MNQHRSPAYIEHLFHSSSMGPMGDGTRAHARPMPMPVVAAAALLHQAAASRYSRNSCVAASRKSASVAGQQRHATRRTRPVA